jgi:hypothetical protein
VPYIAASLVSTSRSPGSISPDTMRTTSDSRICCASVIRVTSGVTVGWSGVMAPS